MLEINLFGPLRIRHAPESDERILAGPIADLFAYLVLHRNRLFSRDTLAGMFWGECDEKHAHGSLNSTLCRLRQIIEPRPIEKGTFLVSPRSSEIGFNPASEFRLDALVFEQHVKPIIVKPISGLSPTDVDTLRHMQALYQGDLIEACAFNWALYERERLRNLFLQSLSTVMDYYEAQRDYAQSVEFGQKILHHDPCREEIHRHLMTLYTRLGQRQLAIKQYEQCCTLLESELDVTPMEETQILFAHIMGSAEIQPPEKMPPAMRSGSVPDLPPAQRLDYALQMLEQVKQQVEATNQALTAIQQAFAALTSMKPAENSDKSVMLR